MKKTLILFPLLAMMAVAGGEAKSVAAETLPVSSDWTVAASGENDTTTVYDTANGYMMDHVNTYQEGGYFNKKVPLDGLSFDIRAENIKDADYFGFCLSKNAASGALTWTTPTFTIWKGLYGSQTRVHVSNTHDYSKPSKAHVSPSADAALGFSVAGSAVMANDSNKTSVGINVSFAKVEGNDEWYELSMTSLDDSQAFWGNNTGCNQTNRTAKGYIAVADMIGDGIDENGKTYIHYTGSRSSSNAAASDITVYIENLKYDFKKGAIKAVDAVNLGDYDGEDNAAIEAAKTAALAEIEAATDEAAVDAAIAKFNAEVAKYKTTDEKNIEAMYANAPETMGTIDNTANFNDYYNNGYSSVRLNDEGGFVARISSGYGHRGTMKSQYDPKNFEITLNFAKTSVNAVSVFTVGNAQGDYINAPVFGMDIAKFDNSSFFVTLSNNGSHNVSIPGFNTETWHGNYTGRYISAKNGDVNIKVTTVGNVSTFSVNNVTVEFDTAVLFEKLTVDKIWLSLGVMTSTASNELVAVKSIKDAAETEYLTDGVFEETSSKLNTIEPLIANGLTPEVYKEYYDTEVYGFASHVAHLQALSGYLHSYDQEYFRSRIDAVVAAGEAYKPTYETYEVETFIANWSALRTEGGENGICAALVKGSAANTKLNELLVQYDGLNDAQKDIVNATADTVDTTIGDSITYVKNVIAGSQATSGEYGLPTTDTSSMISLKRDSAYIVVAIGLLGVLAIATYYFVEKKRFN